MEEKWAFKYMYSRFDIIINKLNSIGVTKLGELNLVRKIPSMLPNNKYASIITIIHNMEDKWNDSKAYY